MIDLNSKRYLRMRDIIGDKKSNPPIPALIPVCASTWWDGIKKGHFPKGKRLGSKCTVWHYEDILALLSK